MIMIRTFRLQAMTNSEAVLLRRFLARGRFWPKEAFVKSKLLLYNKEETDTLIFFCFFLYLKYL